MILLKLSYGENSQFELLLMELDDEAGSQLNSMGKNILEEGNSSTAKVEEAALYTSIPLLRNGVTNAEHFMRASDALYDAINSGADAREVFYSYGKKWGEKLFQAADEAEEIDDYLEKDQFTREIAGRTVTKENMGKRIKQILNPVNCIKGIADSAANIMNPSNRETFHNFDAELNGYDVEELQKAAEEGYQAAYEEATNGKSGGRYGQNRNQEIESLERIKAASD